MIIHFDTNSWVTHEHCTCFIIYMYIYNFTFLSTIKTEKRERLAGRDVPDHVILLDDIHVSPCIFVIRDS